MKSLLLLLLIFVFRLLMPPEIFSQSLLTRAEAVDSAFKNNPAILSSLKQVERQQALKKGSVLFDKTELWLEAPTASRFAVGVQQNFNFPLWYLREAQLQKENVKLAKKELNLNKNSLAKNVELLYLEIQFALGRLSQLKYQDSIYVQLLASTEKRYSVGEVEYLEKVLEETRYSEVNNKLQQQYREIANLKQQLLLLTGIAADSFEVEAFQKYEDVSEAGNESAFAGNPLIGYYTHNKVVSERFLKSQRAGLWPGIFVGYLNQGNADSEVLYRFRFGVSIPLWFPAYTSRIKAARIGIDIADFQYQSAVNTVKVEYYKIYSGLQKNRLNLRYYEEKAMKQAEEIIRTSFKLYNTGEISYFNFLTGLAQGMEIKIQYLNALKEYNMSVIQMKYLKGE